MAIAPAVFVGIDVAKDELVVAARRPGRAPSDPLVSTRRCATIRSCPTPGHYPARKRPPTLEHVRDLWTLRYIQEDCTAAIYRTTFGVELRIEHDGALIESRLSRYGEPPLLLIAEQLKANLLEQGWFEPPNAT